MTRFTSHHSRTVSTPKLPGIRTSVVRMMALVGISATLLNAANARKTDSLSALIAAIAPSPAIEALALIPDQGRKFLALRSYVRTGAHLLGRWSWTEDEIKVFQGSAEQTALLAEVAALGDRQRAERDGRPPHL